MIELNWSRNHDRANIYVNRVRFSFFMRHPVCTKRHSCDWLQSVFDLPLSGAVYLLLQRLNLPHWNTAGSRGHSVATPSAQSPNSNNAYRRASCSAYHSHSNHLSLIQSFVPGLTRLPLRPKTLCSKNRLVAGLRGQCSRKRVRQLKKRKKSCFLDFEKKTLKNVKTDR